MFISIIDKQQYISEEKPSKGVLMQACAVSKGCHIELAIQDFLTAKKLKQLIDLNYEGVAVSSRPLDAREQAKFNYLSSIFDEIDKTALDHLVCREFREEVEK